MENARESLRNANKLLICVIMNANFTIVCQYLSLYVFHRCALHAKR